MKELKGREELDTFVFVTELWLQHHQNVRGQRLPDSM